MEVEIDESVETCTVAEGYRIVKHNNQFFCLKEGQTLEQRVVEKNMLILKPNELSQLQKDGQESSQSGL